MNFLSRFGLFAAAFTFTLGAFSFATGLVGRAAALPQDYQLGLQEAVTPVMQRIDSFHDLLLYIITAITIFVLLLLLWVMFRFSEKRNPNPSRTTHNVVLELAWTVIPVLILIGIAIPSFRLLYLPTGSRTPTSPSRRSAASGTGPSSIRTTATSPSMPS
jgi:cytochrome c oxidase subunit II